MAKTSMVNRETKRAKLAKKFAARREALKKTVSSHTASFEEKMEAAVKLQKLPRDSSPARQRNRCAITGRSRGVSGRSFDGRGNFNMGVKEQIIFPEIDFDQVDAIRGMDIAIATTAKTNEEAKALLEAFRFPFRN